MRSGAPAGESVGAGGWRLRCPAGQHMCRQQQAAALNLQCAAPELGIVQHQLQFCVHAPAAARLGCGAGGRCGVRWRRVLRSMAIVLLHYRAIPTAFGKTVARLAQQTAARPDTSSRRGGECPLQAQGGPAAVPGGPIFIFIGARTGGPAADWPAPLCAALRCAGVGHNGAPQQCCPEPALQEEVAGQGRGQEAGALLLAAVLAAAAAEQKEGVEGRERPLPAALGPGGSGLWVLCVGFQLPGGDPALPAVLAPGADLVQPAGPQAEAEDW